MVPVVYQLLKLNFSIMQTHILKPSVLTKVRLYATLETNKKIGPGGPVYKKRDDEYRISKKASIETLQKLLNIKTFDALQIVMSKKEFRSAPKAILKSNHALYLQKDIKPETLLKYPEVLTVLDTEQKIKQLEHLPYDFDVTIILLLMSKANLIKFVHDELNRSKEDGKIAILSSLLELGLQEACEYIARKSYLCALSSKKMEAKIKILLGYGISKEDICNDFWVLRYREDLIKSRLTLAKESELDTMKTWMVRAPVDTMQNHIRRRSDNKSVLGNSSLVEYLSERLECSADLVNFFILKQPAIQNKSMKKLKELIDLLYSKGFKPQHICRVPKILIHSVETTSKRLKQLEEKGIQIDSLSMLTKSQNQFMQNYETLLKSKNKAKTEI